MAFAVTLIVPETVLAAAGEEMETDGGIVSETLLSTLAVTAALVAELPAPSVATAVNVWFPPVSACVSMM